GFEERLALAGESDSVRILREKQRFDAEPIASDHDAHAVRIASIEDGEREHSGEMAREIRAVLFVQVHDRLDVGSRAKAMSARFQIGAQLLEVVDLAVAHHGDVARLVLYRLTTARDVDDRQASKSETRFAADVQVLVVGTAVLERAG